MESVTSPVRSVWSVADCIVSPLGFTSEENYAQVREGVSGIREVAGWDSNTIFAAAIPDVPESFDETRFEWMCTRALEKALEGVTLPVDKTIFVLSTTKGNIDWLEKDHPRVNLSATAQHLATKFGFQHTRVVSNACISGVLSLLIAKRLLRSGQYDHAVVVGADIMSKFVVSGFKSLMALSPTPCKPFDASRTGINLGEAAAVMVLTTDQARIKDSASFRLAGGSVTNDANHISGPSRSGDELARAIQQALNDAGVSKEQIDFVFAHGTATLYNDEMEAKAFDQSGFRHTPVNSLKGHYGHTLGAAGVVEMIIAKHSMLHNECIPTKGFETHGVSKDITVCHTRHEKSMTRILKTASGFGGCNAALVLQKDL